MGDYYLDVTAVPTSTEIKVVGRIGPNHESVDNTSDGSSSGRTIGDLMKALEAAAAAERQKQERAAADAQAAGRRSVTVCVPTELYSEWKNPAPGSKMARFKAHFKHALQVHAENPDSDMTEWWTIDDRFYPSYDPDDPLGNVVSNDSPGSCGLNASRDTFVINP